MPNTALIIDVVQLFQKTFGTRPVVGIKNTKEPVTVGEYRVGQINNDQVSTPKGSLLQERDALTGVDIWLPIKFFDVDRNMTMLMNLPYSVIRIGMKKTVIKTPMVERRGTVKEIYNVDDYSITIRGFLIGENRQFPEAELELMKELGEKRKAVYIENAITNIFLTVKDLPADEQRRVVINDVEFPEIQGKKHIKPFVMNLESDTIFKLEWEGEL